jgi:hypothetical protein
VFGGGYPHTQRGIGDPFVQLGQGHAGRAKLVDESQDELISPANPVTLVPGATWKRYGIVCSLSASSVRCTNGTGHGFKISPATSVCSDEEGMHRAPDRRRARRRLAPDRLGGHCLWERELHDPGHL